MSQISAAQYFLQLAGAPGEADVDPHKKWVSLLEFGWGGAAQSTVASTSGSSGVPITMYPMNAVGFLDTGMSKIGELFTIGKPVATATLAAMKGGGTEDYLIVKLTEVLITSYNVSCSGEAAVVNLSFTYATIAIQYKAQGATGDLEAASSYSFNVTQRKVSSI